MNTRGFGVLRPRTLTHFARRLALGLVTTSLLAAGTVTVVTPAQAQALEPQTLTVTTTRMNTAPDVYERRVQRLVNRRRDAHGLRRLRMASCPDTVAEGWSQFLASNNEFFHQSMTDVLNRCNARYAGETLGRGAMSPRKLVRMWMQSPGHRAVLLSSKSRRIGVGATPDTFGRWVVAANFVRF
jgi:uncharacterized protein YkwD